jgi:uncharacterized membrane protein YidH (DUF202 family)
MTTSQSINRQDGTLTLLRTGVGVLIAGLIFLLLTVAVLGGVDRHGPHTSSGWLALMAAMLCLPLGLMLLALGAAKWLRNRGRS